MHIIIPTMISCGTVLEKVISTQNITLHPHDLTRLTACKKWWHDKCLNAHPDYERDDANLRNAFAQSGDFIVVKPQSKAKGKKPRGRPSKSKANDDDKDAPSIITLLARLPIYRGQQTRFGIVGNAFAVLDARERLANRTFDDFKPDMQDPIYTEVERMIEEEEDEDVEVGFECPDCGEVM